MIPSLARILFATALSERSDMTLRQVLGLAAATGAEVRILHVVEPLSEDARLTLMSAVQDDAVRQAALSQRLGTARQRLDQQLARFWSSLGPGTQQFRESVTAVEVVEGFPAEMILRKAAAHACDRIVLGAHERAITHTFLGSIAKGVLRHARIATLVVPFRSEA
ncbi:universal stress protein [soil metagenome]